MSQAVNDNPTIYEQTAHYRLAIFRDTGFGARLLRAAIDYTNEYVFSPDEGSDHDPTEFERFMMIDMVNGMFSDEKFAAILQEAARGMKAGGMDPEGVDLPKANV